MSVSLRNRIFASIIRLLAVLTKFLFGILLSSQVSAQDFIFYVQFIYFLPFLITVLGLEIYNRVQLKSNIYDNLTARIFYVNIQNQIIICALLYFIYILIFGILKLHALIFMFIILEIIIIEINRYFVAVNKQFFASIILLIKNIIGFISLFMMYEPSILTIFLILVTANIFATIYGLFVLDLRFSKSYVLPLRFYVRQIRKYWLVLISVSLVKLFWAIDKKLLDFIGTDDAFSYAYTAFIAAGFLTLYEIFSGMFVTPKVLHNLKHKKAILNGIYKELALFCCVILVLSSFIGLTWTHLHFIVPNATKFDHTIFSLLVCVIIFTCLGYPITAYFTLMGRGGLLFTSNVLLLGPLFLLLVFCSLGHYVTSSVEISLTMLIGAVLSLLFKFIGLKYG